MMVEILDGWAACGCCFEYRLLMDGKCLECTTGGALGADEEL